MFLPGLISFLIINTLTSHYKRNVFEVIMFSLLLGFLNYVVLDTILFYLSNYMFNIKAPLYVFCTILNQAITPDINKITVASVLAIPFGFILTGIINTKIIYIFANFFKLSKHHGSVNVFSCLMNNRGNQYVVIRDRENNRMYQGWIEYYPDKTDKEGIFLRDVSVYKNTSGKRIYDIDGIYLPDLGNLIMEYQIIKKEKNNVKDTAKTTFTPVDSSKS